MLVGGFASEAAEANPMEGPGREASLLASGPANARNGTGSGPLPG